MARNAPPKQAHGRGYPRRLADDGAESDDARKYKDGIGQRARKADRKDVSFLQALSQHECVLGADCRDQAETKKKSG